jgi:hypothetical protein
MSRLPLARPHPLAGSALLLTLAACGEATVGEGSCGDVASLQPGEASAAVDGAPWTSVATWVWQGESLQLNTTSAGGWRLTLVAQEAADGSTVLAAVEAGAFPVEVALSEAGGGWALAYPDAGASLSTDAGSGTLTLSALSGEVLDACFAFEAASQDGASVRVEEGRARATPFLPAPGGIEGR